MVIALPAALGLLLLFVPLLALLVRSPWSRLPHLLSSTTATTAMRLSLETATLATLISFGLGVPLAWVLARVEFRGRSVVRSAVLLPLVLPPVVGGVALLQAFGRVGLVGQYLDRWFGYDLPFTTTAVVIAETFVAMPFLVITVEGALRSADRGLDEAAATLGASRIVVFWRVTLPLIRPSLLAGAVLCWARALGEFGATITFAGNFPGTTQTMPLAIYNAMESDPESAYALSLVLLVFALTVLTALRERWLGGGAST